MPEIKITEAPAKISEISISKVHVIKDRKRELKQQDQTLLGQIKIFKLRSRDNSSIHQPKDSFKKIKRAGKKVMIDYLKSEGKFVYSPSKRNSDWQQEKVVDTAVFLHYEPKTTKNKNNPMETEVEEVQQPVYEVRDELKPEEKKELYSLSLSDENLSLEQKETNMITIENDNVAKELIFDQEDNALLWKHSQSVSSKGISLSDFEHEDNDSDIDIDVDVVSSENSVSQVEIKQNELPKLSNVPKLLKKSLSTIEEHHSMDESWEDGMKTEYYDSVYSWEPFDLEKSVQEQLSFGEFKLKIENGSVLEESESLLKNEILIDDLLWDV